MEARMHIVGDADFFNWKEAYSVGSIPSCTLVRSYTWFLGNKKRAAVLRKGWCSQNFRLLHQFTLVRYGGGNQEVYQRSKVYERSSDALGSHPHHRHPSLEHLAPLETPQDLSPDSGSPTQRKESKASKVEWMGGVGGWRGGIYKSGFLEEKSGGAKRITSNQHNFYQSHKSQRPV